MTRDLLFDALCKLLPPQFALLIDKLGAPTHFLPGPNAPQVERVLGLLKWADQVGAIADVERCLLEVGERDQPIRRELSARSSTAGSPSAPSAAALAPRRKSVPVVAALALAAAVSTAALGTSWVHRQAAPGVRTAANPSASVTSAEANTFPSRSNTTLGTISSATARAALSDHGCPPMMARIVGGPFVMKTRSRGRGKEDPDRPVTVATFCLDKTEVTVEQYHRCVDEGHCTKAAEHTSCNFNKLGKDREPINCVTWEQARRYCESRGERLPTDTEWEYTARGSQHRIFPWGNAPPTANQLCWKRRADLVDAGEPLGTCKVGEHPLDTTPDGVLDMAGNVREWVRDETRPDEDKAPVGDSHFVRGASWMTSLDPQARGAERNPQWSYQEDVGFRCAKSGNDL